MSSVIDQRAAVGDHVVQFYERESELVACVGDYLSDAADAGAVGVVIATAAHRAAFEAYLREAGVDVAAARDDGTLVVLDAAEMLARLMRDGCVDRAAFFEVVGAVVRQAAAAGRPVCAYGEMVALLWEAGDVIAAIELESLWNELATEVPFSLYCAYRSESVEGREHADALERVCHQHSAVVSVPQIESTWRFTADVTAPAEARHLLAGELRRGGHDGRQLDDARLVISELAANAVLHARSPFSISISSRDSTIRIGVHDESQVVPEVHEPSLTDGRGMHLVAALASRWGVDVTPAGKVVWAELSR
jgi:anti-sigma regulatory factor (Ser/Thr protein kinase)